MLDVFRTDLLPLQQCEDFHNLWIFPFFACFPIFQSLWLTAVKQYWPHTAKAKALSSVWQRFAREKKQQQPLVCTSQCQGCAPFSAGPDTSLLLCLHTGAHRSSDTSTKEPQARGSTNPKVQQSRKDANYLLPNNAWPGCADFCVGKGAKIKAGWKIGGFVLMETLWIAQVWKWLHCNYTAT